MAKTYTVKEVADILGYSTNSIYTFLKENRIKGVRVGKGRFRISQEELEHLMGSQVTQGIGLSQPAESTHQDIESHPPAIHHTNPLFSFARPMRSVRVGVPMLHDWFVGLSSIIIGFSIFLFSQYFEEFAIRGYALWFIPIRFGLLLGGLGLLLSDMTHHEQPPWHTLFQVVITVSWSILAFVLWQAGDVSGVILFGLLAVSCAIGLIVPLGGVSRFVLYVSFVALALPAVVVTDLAPFFTSVLQTFGDTPFGFGFILFGLMMSMVVLLWLGYMKSSILYQVVCTLFSLLFFGFAVLYARDLQWGRSLFILLLGLTSIFAPIWDGFEFNQSKERKAVFHAFGAVLGIFVITIIVLRTLQTNMVEYVSAQLSDKVTYGTFTVEMALERAKLTLESAAQNRTVVVSLEDKEHEVTSGILRSLYEGNRDFQHVYLTNSVGEIVSGYPLNSVSVGTNVFSKEYIQRPLLTQRGVAFDMIDDQGDSTNSRVILGVPVFTDETTVGGVLVGVINVTSIGLKLQQIASSSNGEYFLVTNDEDKSIIGPQAIEVSATARKKDSLSDQSANGSLLRYNNDGVRVFHMEQPIENSDWIIAIEAPLTKSLRSTNAASLVLFLVSIGSAFVIWMYFLMQRPKQQLPDTVDPG